jgi:hypothetical protein
LSCPTFSYLKYERVGQPHSLTDDRSFPAPVSHADRHPWNLRRNCEVRVALSFRMGDNRIGLRLLDGTCLSRCFSSRLWSSFCGIPKRWATKRELLLRRPDSDHRPGQSPSRRLHCQVALNGGRSVSRKAVYQRQPPESQKRCIDAQTEGLRQILQVDLDLSLVPNGHCDQPNCRE